MPMKNISLCRASSNLRAISAIRAFFIVLPLFPVRGLGFNPLVVGSSSPLAGPTHHTDTSSSCKTSSVYMAHRIRLFDLLITLLIAILALGALPQPSFADSTHRSVRPPHPYFHIYLARLRRWHTQVSGPAASRNAPP